MKFPYIVRHNGIDYPIGADVPMGEKVNKVVAEKKEEKEVDDVVVHDEPKEKVYSRTDINKMTTEELRNLGVELKIKGAEDKSGSQLKRIIPEKLGI